MALGNLRQYAEFQSNNELYYKVEIYDEDWTSSSTEFKIGAEGFKLKYEGSGKHRWTELNASSVSFTYFAQNATDDTFTTEIATRVQGKIRVKILVGTTPTPTDVFWVGTLLPDVGNFEDTHYPRKHKFTAVCGLSLLKGVDFDKDVYQSGLTLYSVKNILQNMLRYYSNTVDFFGATDDFLKTCVNWREDSMPSASNTEDPLDNSGIYPRTAFIDVSNEGQNVSIDAYSVLENLCRCFGARLFQADGVWNFIQPDIYSLMPLTGGDGGYRVHRYSGSTLNSSGNFDESKAIDFTNIYHLSGRTTKYMKQLKTVQMEYDKWGSGNWNGVLPFYYTGDASASYTELGWIENNIQVQLNFYNNAVITQTTGTLVNDAFAYLNIYVKNTDSGGTAYYLQSDYTWGTSEDYIVVPANQWGDGFSPGNQIWAPDLQVILETEGGFVTTNAGTLELKIEFEVVDEWTNSSSGITQSDFSGTDIMMTGTTGSGIYYLQDDTLYYDESVTQIARQFKSSQGDGTVVMSLGKCRIGDGPTTTSKGRIRVHNGTTWLNEINEDWVSMGTGATERITQIAVRDFLAGQDKFIEQTFLTIHWESTDVFSYLDAYTMDSKTYVPQGGTFNANRGEFKTELWEAYQADIATIGGYTSEEIVVYNNADVGNSDYITLENDDTIISGH